MLSCTAPSLLLSWVKILNKVSVSSLRHATESSLTTKATELISQLVQEILIVLMSQQKPRGETTKKLIFSESLEGFFLSTSIQKWVTFQRSVLVSGQSQKISTGILEDGCQ